MEQGTAAIFTIDGQPHISLIEAARRVQVAYQRVKEWVMSGKVPAARLDGRWYLPLGEVERLQRDGPPPRRKPVPKNRDQHLKQLAEARAKPERLERLRAAAKARGMTPEWRAQLASAREAAWLKREAAKGTAPEAE